METFLPIISLSSIAAVLAATFLFGFKLDQHDWRTLLYPVVMILLGGLLGWIMHIESKGNPLLLPGFYTALQGILLLFGIFHLWFMYKKLFWSKRNSLDGDNDSILPEAVYTVVLFCFLGIGVLLSYGYFAGFAKIGIYWAISIPFLIPFFFIKSYDFINQIPKRDFSHKWQFTNHPIKESSWNWENEVWINFEVKEKLKSTKIKTNRFAAFKILGPRKAPIREVFRLAIREYNKKGPEVVVQDLGFERENEGMFWWLFSIKFVWNRPATWWRKIRYLDPYVSFVANEIHPKDIIRARRMLTMEAFQNKEEYFDGDVAMGELAE